MSDERARRRREVSTVQEATTTEPAQNGTSADRPFAEVETAEDTVPYLAPLASRPVRIQITDVGQGVPHIYPDEILDEDG